MSTRPTVQRILHGGLLQLWAPLWRWVISISDTIEKCVEKDNDSNTVYMNRWYYSLLFKLACGGTILRIKTFSLLALKVCSQVHLSSESSSLRTIRLNKELKSINNILVQVLCLSKDSQLPHKNKVSPNSSSHSLPLWLFLVPLRCTPRPWENVCRSCRSLQRPYCPLQGTTVHTAPLARALRAFSAAARGSEYKPIIRYIQSVLFIEYLLICSIQIFWNSIAFLCFYQLSRILQDGHQEMATANQKTLQQNQTATEKTQQQI